MLFQTPVRNFIATVECFAGYVVCNAWCFYWKSKIGHIFCRACISRTVISILGWFCCDMGVWRNFFFLKKSLVYITETGPADESFLHCFRKMIKKMMLPLASRHSGDYCLLADCFWAPLEYLTVVGPAVVVTGIASQVQTFPIPPCFWWCSPFQLSP